MAAIRNAAPQFRVDDLRKSRRPWAALELAVADPDGYILCFSQAS